MAVSNASLIQCRWNGSGSDDNGGGFDWGTTGKATDLAATSGNTASPVVSSASYTFVAGDVGHWVHIAAGTNWIQGWYKIASVNAGAATLTATAGAGMLPQNSWFLPTTAAGCATVASPTSGTFSVDYTHSSTAILALTDLVCNNNTTLTSATGGFTKAMVGNYMRLVSGTNATAGWYRITGYTDTNTVTIDTKCNSGSSNMSAGVGNFGGALLTPGRASGMHAANNAVFVETCSLTITSTSTDVANGLIRIKSGTGVTTPTSWRAHASQDLLTRNTSNYVTLTLQASLGSSLYVMGHTTGASHVTVDHFDIDGNGNTSNIPFYFPSASNTVSLRWCKAKGGQTYMFYCNNRSVLCYECVVTRDKVDSGGFLGCMCIGCFVEGTASTGGSVLGGYYQCVCYACVSESLPKNYIDCVTFNSVAYSANTSNTNVDSIGTHSVHVNMLSELTASSGPSFSTTAGIPGMLINCASFRCGGTKSTFEFEESFQAVSGSSGSLMVDPANNDFALDSTAAEGLALRAAGYPGTTAISTTTGKADVGFPTSATNTAASSGGLMTHPGMAGGARG